MLIGAAVNFAAQNLLSNDSSTSGSTPFPLPGTQQQGSNSVSATSGTQQSQTNSASNQNQVPAWMQTLQQNQGQGSV